MAGSETRSTLPHTLFEIGKVIGSAESLGLLLGRISQLVTELVGAEACSIMLLDEGRQQLLGKAAYGLERENIGSISFRVGQGVAGWVAEHGEPALIADVTGDERFVALPDSNRHIRSLVCVPLIFRDQLVGVMTATSGRIGAFDEGHLDLLGFVAATMALDVENWRLRRLAVTDALTGAYNREFLASNLPEAVTRARRGEPLCVAMVDIDHFKQVNDEHGHDVGDVVLAEVAARLRGAIRGGDTLIRYGGEEFLIILPGTELAAALAVAERMRQRLGADPIHVRGLDIEVRISVGVAQLAPDDLADDLLRRSDRALYAAKEAGRDRVEVL